MTRLGELYTDISRIDQDARGGYARVAEVRAVNPQDGQPELRAFKLMRHEIDYRRGMDRFESELRLLNSLWQDPKAPTTITRLYNSGFASVELSSALHHNDIPDPRQTVYATGANLEAFLRLGQELQEKDPGRWLPYLVVELAPYDDSLLRQIHHQPQDDNTSGIYRLPTGEVIAMAIQLLEVVEYLHKNHGRAYMDWKPEHLFWNGLRKQIKLIDWNVTAALEDGPGKRQNIRDDLRLFCGAVLYIGLTFVDPDDPAQTIGPRPTTELKEPVPEIRRRYWTDRPDFHQRDTYLDEQIKKIIQKGLDPNQGFESPIELKQALLEYARKELGITPAELIPSSKPIGDYFKALAEMRIAQAKLLHAQQQIIEAVGNNGENPELERVFETIKRALKNFPIS